MEEKDYVLARIDDWNYRRISEKYTLDVEAEIIEDIANMPSEEVDSELATLLGFYSSRENMLESSRGYFSRKYSKLEVVLNSISPEDSRNGVIQEYVRPILDRFKPLVELVDLVRKKFTGSFPDELSDGDIEECFREVFPKLDDYSNYVFGLIDSILPALNIINSSISEKREFERFSKSFGKLVPKISNKIYGDIYAS